MQGASIWDAARTACRLRLRPIVMTSIAFIAGAVPLLIGQGAGAEVRAATGITVFSGMLGVTLFGLFLTPVFYVTLRKLSGTQLRPQDNTAMQAATIQRHHPESPEHTHG
jgi:multidrug efflux pump